MINQDELERFEKLRTKVFEQIKIEMNSGSGAKCSEGSFAIKQTFPSYFGDIKQSCIIELWLYIFGPSRHYEWEGNTFNEALTLAEAEIFSWIEE